MKPQDVNEIVLQSETGNELYEGLSSNFFVVQNGIVITAPPEAVNEEVILLDSFVTLPIQVLAGTIQELVIQSCKEKNIPLARKFPLISDLHLWEGCFITSTILSLVLRDFADRSLCVGTSRLLLPVHCVRVYETKQERKFDVDSCVILKQLQDSIKSLLKDNSTKIV